MMAPNVPISNLKVHHVHHLLFKLYALKSPRLISVNMLDDIKKAVFLSDLLPSVFCTIPSIFTCHCLLFNVTIQVEVFLCLPDFHKRPGCLCMIMAN